MIKKENGDIETKMITRSIVFSLKKGNTSKLESLDELWIEYRMVVNSFLDCIREDKELTEDFIKAFKSKLSYRYRQCTRRQAYNIYKSWYQRNKKCIVKTKQGKCNPPIFCQLNNPSMVLDNRFITLEKSENSFDYWVKISTLNKRRPIRVPIKSYNYANKYFKSWDLVNGGRLIKKNGIWTLILTFRKSFENKDANKVIGIDTNFNKMLVTSDAKVYGAHIRDLIEKASRKQQGSKADKRVRQEIKTEINRVIKQLPRDTNIGVEDLKNLKKNKKGVWNHKVNHKFNYWYYALILKRIEEFSEINGVHFKRVPSAYSSQDCPLCGYRDEGNRNSEIFECLHCHFRHDADYVGSLNVLSRFTQEHIVPEMIKLELEYVY